MKVLPAWVIPPLLGVVAWAAFRPGTPAPEPFLPGAAFPGTPFHKPLPIDDGIAAFQQEWMARESAKKGPDLPDDPEKLRTRVHTLIASIAQLEQPAGDDEITPEQKNRLIAQRAQLSEAARKLGRLQQGEALEWILPQAPQLRIEVMAGWAEANPVSALERVIVSRQMEPCGRDTLFQMLEANSSGDGKALRDTVQRVPWVLFASSPVEHRSQLALPENADPALWTNSGTAQWLSTQGVSAGNLFYNWARQQPDKALAAWEMWPSVSSSPSRESVDNLSSLLAAGVNDADSRSAIQAAVRNLPGEKQAVISRLMVENLREFPDTRRRFATVYPELFPPASEK